MASLFLRRCSSFTIIISGVRGFASTTTTSSSTTTTVALKVLSRHIQDLSKKYYQLFQMRKDLRRRGVQISNLNLVQRLLLNSQPRVVYQLGCLEKLYEEIVPLEFLSRDAPPPLSYCPLRIINRQLTALHRKLAAISQIEGSPYPGVPLDQQQRDVPSTNFRVVHHHHINVLTKVLEEIAWKIALDPSKKAESSRGDFEDQLRNRVMSESKRLPEIMTSDHSLTQFKTGMEKNETVESKPLDKNRYLLVSNGQEIHCLDLNQSTDPSFSNADSADDVPLLPIIATLNLQEENLPIRVALFKWRSNAYMLGGEKFSNSSSIYYSRVVECDRNPAGLLAYRHNRALHSTNRDEPTCVIRGLSLDDSKTRLSHFESNMGKPKNPQIWPFVEEMNDKIHVISCEGAVNLRNPYHWLRSHEVLDRDSGCWVEDVPILENIDITSYLVLGKKMYAVSCFHRPLLVFDSKKKKWETGTRTPFKGRTMSRAIRDVWDIIGRLHALRCVGEFAYGDVRDPLYVVIGVDNFGNPSLFLGDEDEEGTRGVAFLVNSSGLILGIQPLVRFFNGLDLTRQATIIEVEEDGWGKKTMCSIATGLRPPAYRRMWPDRCTDICVSINIFTVEEFPDAADKVRQVVAKGSEAWPAELEFVRVDILERHVYKTHVDVDSDVLEPNPLKFKLQACFI